MNKGDIEFTVDLNTTPAEKKLNDLRNKASSERSYYANLFKDVMQGFSMQGSSYSGYMGANNFGVPAIQNFERSISSVTNTMQKFTMVMEAMVRAQGFLMYGRPYSPQSSAPIYQGSNIAGYLPSSTSPNIRAWTPTEHYTRAQANAINHSKVFDNLIFNRNNGGSDFSQQNVYDTFMRMNNASAMYEMWQNTFSSSPLMLEAPEPIATGAGGNKIYQKYNKFGQPVGEKKTPATKNAIAPKELSEGVKDIVFENKKDNTEWTHKLFLLEAIKTALKAIHILSKGIATAWNGIKSGITGANADVTKDTGFFSKDTVGALRANSDRTRAMIYAGLKAYGANAPFSAGAFDTASALVDEQWTNAVSGKGVNENYAIATERLKRMFGIDLTAEALLTGARNGMGSTDIIIDAMRKVDFSKFASLDNIAQGQIRGDLLTILGAELTDALLSYANIRPGEDLITRVISKGGGAWHSKNLNEDVLNATDSLADLDEAFTKLRNTLIDDFAPAFIHVTNGLVAVVDFINKMLNKGKGEKDEFGEIKNELSISGSSKHYKDFKQDASTDKDKLSLVSKPKTVSDVFNNLYVGSGRFKYASDIEGLKIRYEQERIGKALYEDNLNSISSDPIAQMLLMTGGKQGLYKQLREEEEDIFTQNRDLEKFFTGSIDNEMDMLLAIQTIMRSRTMGKYFSKAFGKGGVFDFNAGMDILSYLFADENFTSPEEQMQYINGVIQNIKESKWGKDYITDIKTSSADKNYNGQIDFGETTLTVVLKDQYGTTLTTSNLSGKVR